MAATWIGSGTIFYGRRGQSDGSYITTKWAVLVFVPLIPLGSYRVFDKTPIAFQWKTSGWRSHLRLTRTTLNWRQVLGGYVATAIVIGLAAFLILTKTAAR
jgi:hypothetical protein